jgi:hypothetical protein
MTGLEMAGELMVGEAIVGLFARTNAPVPVMLLTNALVTGPQWLVPVPSPSSTEFAIAACVLDPVPTFVSTAMMAAFWTSWPPARLGLLVSFVAVGLGRLVPLSSAVGNRVLTTQSPSVL